MKSVMSHSFGQVPLSDISKSTFDRSHGCKTAFDSGYLVPFYIDEVLPGDKFDVTANMMARMSTPVCPIMDNMFLDTFYFYVPSRLVWNNFTKLMGERVNPNDSIDYLVPQITSGDDGFAVGSLADYFGIPTGVPNLSVNALPFRAYAKIWDDWFRDCNLQNSIIQQSSDLDDQGGNIAWNTLRKRCKKRDYLTSCLPSPQMGAGVELPIGGTAPVIGTGCGLGLTNGNDTFTLKTPNQTSASSLMPGAINVAQMPATTSSSVQSMPANSTIGVATDPENSGLVADLSSATSTTINSLRTAFQIQRMLETDSRCGCARYISIILAHFKTVSPDGRLQRSEYLGGHSQLINVSAVAQTSGTSETTDTPQGNLAAVVKVNDVNGFSKGFTEHGYVIGLVQVRADLNYQQGVNRMWSRRTRYDFYWPTLAHLGEQAVLNKEIYADGTADDDKTFGYQERYAEYRYHPSIITGKLRSTVTDGSLDVWHLAQYFRERPVLNGDFIQDNPPIERALAVNDEPQFIFDSYIRCICTRPMPLYSIPGMIDHF